MTAEEKIERIKEIIFEYGQIDGSHHKMWVIDQIMRTIYENLYDEIIHHYEYIDDNGEESTEQIYEWDCGIAP